MQIYLEEIKKRSKKQKMGKPTLSVTNHDFQT